MPWDISVQPCYVLRDLDGDNVAIVDTRGAASGQQAHLLTLAVEWRYDAYGSVNWSRIHRSHSVLACGHRGVFFDRLDEPVIRFAADAASGDATWNPPSLGETWDTRVLVEPQVAGGGFDLPAGKPKIIGHMRNREYLPHLMRFAQRDPNATGQLVMAAVSHSGNAIGTAAGLFELSTLYRDGPNLSGYLSGRPRSRCDPLGLEAFEYEVDAGYGAEDFYGDWMDVEDFLSPVPTPAGYLQSALGSLVGQYAANQEADLDWAMDWSQPDDAHTRGDNKWVTLAIGEGLRGAFDINIPFTGVTFNPLGAGQAGSDYALKYGTNSPNSPRFSKFPGKFKGYGGPYSAFRDPSSVRNGGDFQQSQKRKIIAANKTRNGGRLRSDVTGRYLQETSGSDNSVEIDHIMPKSKGGSNSYKNAQVTEKFWNRSKGNRY